MQPESWQNSGAELISEVLSKDNATISSQRKESMGLSRDVLLLLLPRRSKRKRDRWWCGDDKTTSATSEIYRSSPAAMQVCRLAGSPSEAKSDSEAQQYARIEGR